VSAGGARPRLLLWLRSGLLVYLLALATATHWPKLQIDGPVARSDLFVHVGAFGLLTVLCALSRPAGTNRCNGAPGGLSSPANLTWSAALAGAYATIDELTQGIPALHRTVALSDWLANMAGVALGVAVVALVPLGGRSAAGR